MKASNLGQIIGRLQLECGEELADRQPVAAPPPREAAPATDSVRRVYRGLKAEARALLERHPEGLSQPQMRVMLNASPQQITDALYTLPIEKLGRRRHYVYRLKDGREKP